MIIVIGLTVSKIGGEVKGRRGQVTMKQIVTR